MTKEQARVLERYFDSGHLIMITDSGYVDSPVQGIYLTDEEDEYVYDSEVFSERPLSEVHLSCVIVARPIRDLDSKYDNCDYTDFDPMDVEKIDGVSIYELD